MSIAERLEMVRGSIARASERAQLQPSVVQLIAVSKGHPVEAIRAAYASGQRRFGENYAQELLQKAEQLSELPDLEWHFIGKAQRNKVRDLVRIAQVIETVDRSELVAELGKRALRTIDVCIEVNVGGESQKAGCAPERVASLIAEVRELPNLRCVGLMTIPPQDLEATPFFEQLSALATRLRAEGCEPGPQLSMGMSADFEQAIACGATWVRVGTAIFGERPARRSEP